MRTIKFRIPMFTDKGRFTEFQYLKLGDDIEGTLAGHNGEPQQFTGLLDKNGVAEVYEGDIINPLGIIKGNIYESPQVYERGIDCLIEGMGTNAWRDTESRAMGFGCKYAQ